MFKNTQNRPRNLGRRRIAQSTTGVLPTQQAGKEKEWSPLQANTRLKKPPQDASLRRERPRSTQPPRPFTPAMGPDEPLLLVPPYQPAIEDNRPQQQDSLVGILRVPVPAHQPRAGAGIDPTSPYAIAIRQADRHMTGLSGAAKTGVYATWASSNLGRIDGSLLGSLAQLGEAAPPFAMLSALCALYDSYLTYTGARKARDDYLTALGELSTAQAELTDLEHNPDADPERKARLALNVLGFTSAIASYERNYHTQAQRDKTTQLREEIVQLLVRRAQLRGSQTALQAAIDNGDAARLRASAEQFGSPEHEMTEIAGQLRDVEQQLELRLPDPDTQPDARDIQPFNPVGNLDAVAQAAIVKVRDVHVQVPKAAVDLTANSLAMTTALDAASLIAEATGLGALGSILGIAMARLDMEHGKREHQQASDDKLSTLKKASCAGQLHALYAKGHSDDDAVCQQLSWSYMIATSLKLGTDERSGRQGQKRNLRGTVSTGVGIAGLGIGVGAAVAFPPLAVLPVAAGMTVGALWAGNLALGSLDKKQDKNTLKAYKASTDAFVRRFGVDGIRQLFRDAKDPAARAAWDARLQQHHARLATLHGSGVVAPGFLTVEGLLDNPYLGVEWLTHALHARSRDQDPTHFAAEADLVQRLAETTGATSPLALSCDAFESAAAHSDWLRLTLCALYQIKPYSPDKVPMHVERKPDEIAGPLGVLLNPDLNAKFLTTDEAHALARLSSHLHGVSRGVAAQAMSPRDMQSCLQALQVCADRLREHFGVGPAELRTLQKACFGDLSSLPPAARALLEQPHVPLLLELLADPSWVAAPPAAMGEAAPARVQTPSGPELRAQGDAIGDLLAGAKQAGRAQRDGPPIRTPQASQRRRARTRARRDQSPPQRAKHRSREMGKSLRRKASSGVKHFKQMLPNPQGTPDRVIAALAEAAPGPERRALLANLLKAVCAQTLGPSLRIPRTPAIDADLAAGKTEQAVVKAFIEERLMAALASAETALDSIHAAHSQYNSTAMHRLVDKLEGARRVADVLLVEFGLEAEKAPLNELYPLHIAPAQAAQ